MQCNNVHFQNRTDLMKAPRAMKLFVLSMLLVAATAEKGDSAGDCQVRGGVGECSKCKKDCDCQSDFSCDKFEWTDKNGKLKKDNLCASKKSKCKDDKKRN